VSVKDRKHLQEIKEEAEQPADSSAEGSLPA
jgi:hypothetical protein